ncbi:MAG: isocitrate lyase/PEP mutase family protein [Betaproteobacteria bacterium]|nr:isocitrate lyase/PEP mutase family protein [Betaproteobacteria bacterium]
MKGSHVAKKTFRELLAVEGPLILPGAHDALSARLIQQAGFEGFFIGGFPAVGVRYGVPDIGLMALGEISAAVRDILSACNLPVLVDMDNGYGDVKNVVHSMHTYERMGVSAIFLEDQRWPKRCGHMAGKDVVAPEEMEAKVRAAAAERMNPDTFIWARTDARAVHGLDDALRRAERYVRAGADGIFIEAPRTVAELEIIGRSFDVPQSANPLEGGVTPVLKPEEFFQLGFKVLPYGINLLMHITKTMQLVLEDIRSGRFAMTGKGATFKEYVTAVGFDDWAGIDERHGGGPMRKA